MPANLHFFEQFVRSASRRASVQQAFDVEHFLYAEADLLDSWRFEEWLKMLAPDIHYWAPVRENRTIRELDQEVCERGGAAHFDENYQLLEQRVARLTTKTAWAESPPSRSRHLITNVRVFTTQCGTDGDFEVDSCFQVYRSSGERSHDAVFGRRIDILDRSSEYGFVIKERTILFDMSTILVKNLSLIY